MRAPDLTTGTVLRILLPLIVALACLFLVDHALYGLQGFSRMFGEATLEGQVLQKARVADRYAEVADIVFFGSSLTRNGISSEPFLERGVLPFNYGVSLGGPIFGYHVLAQLRPVLERRERKPVLVVELFEPFLIPADFTQRKAVVAAFSELETFTYLQRSRTEKIVAAPDLLATFGRHGVGSRFVSSVILPSSVYRQFVPQLVARRGYLGERFFGMEDCCGFAPFYYTNGLPSSMVVTESPPIPVEAFDPGKLMYLRRFLALAHELGCPVALLAQPVPATEDQASRFDALYAALQGEYPDLRLIRSAPFGLTPADFADNFHVNIWGADTISSGILAALGLGGDQATLTAKLAHLGQSVEVPAVAHWQASPGEAPDASGWPDWAAVSPEVELAGGGEVVVEVEVGTPLTRARLALRSVDGSGRVVGPHTPTEVVFADRPRRMFARLHPSTGRFHVFLEAQGGQRSDVRVIRAFQVADTPKR